MNKTPWKSDNWFVSPWNYLDEVKKDFIIPEKVKIHDVTLRDGEQQARIIFTRNIKNTTGFDLFQYLVFFVV